MILPVLEVPMSEVVKIRDPIAQYVQMFEDGATCANGGRLHTRRVDVSFHWWNVD